MDDEPQEMPASARHLTHHHVLFGLLWSNAGQKTLTIGKVGTLESYLHGIKARLGGITGWRGGRSSGCCHA